MFPFGIASHGPFRRQIILTFAVGFFALVTAFAVYMVKSERDHLYRDSIGATTGLAQSLAVSSLPWVLANDVEGLQEAVQAFRAYPELRYAMVISPTGRVLAHSDAAKVGQFVTDAQSLALLKMPPRNRIMADDAAMADVAVPVSIRDRHVGWARIALARENIAGDLRKTIWRNVLFVLLATVSSLLAAILIANRLGYRIGSLVRVAEKVQAGDFATRASVPGARDEIATLGDSLNQMLDALARNEQELRAASRYTRSLIEASLDPLVTISAEGKITDVNLATEKVTGRSRAELIGTDFSDYFTEPDKARAGYRQVFARGYVTDYPLVLRHRDGHVTDVLYNASVYRDEAGEVLGVFAAARDVTERKRAEATRTQLAAIVESTNDAIIGKTTDGIITSWNKGAESIYGYTADEVIGKPITFLAPPSRHAEIQEFLGKIRNGETVTNYESERIRKDGALIHVALTLSPISDASGRITGISTIARDITERKQNEAANASRLHLLQFAQTHSLDELLEETINEAERLTGSLIGFYHFVEEDQNSLTLQCWSTRTKAEFCKAEGKGLHYPIADAGVWADCARQGKPVIHNDYAALPDRKGMPEGHATVIRELVVPVRRGDKLSAILGVGNKPTNYTESDVETVLLIADLTGEIAARKRAEEELRQAGVYNRSLIEASLDPLVTISAEGKITDVNLATEKVTGRSRAELIGTDFSDYFTEPDKARAGYQQVFAQGYVTDYPLALRHHDGRVADVLYNASIYRNEAGEVLGVFAAARDVTERKKAEQEVAQLSLQNKLILDSVGEGIYGLGSDGRCTFVNPTALQLLGFSVEELVGQHAHYVFHHTRPDGRAYPEEECPVQVAYKQGEVHRGDDLYWRKDGSSFPVEFISTPILDAGKITGAVVTFRDITERKLAEEKVRRSEHSLSEAQRIAHLGNWELDLVHNVLTWSDEIYRIFEIDPQKFGASYEAFLNAIHPDDRDMVNKAYTDSLANRVPYDIVHRLRMQDGRIKFVNEMCETYYGEDGKPLRSVGTVHDITERKLAEDEVKALNRELEQRVIVRTAELEAANKELEAFSYSVSHDLRTPLRAIDGFSRIVLDDYRDKLDDEGKRLLNVVRDNTIRMGQLIDDILKFSRAGRTEIAYAEIDMERMAHAVFDELRPSVAGDKLQLEIEHLPPARGDSAMMRQVFVNLLSNAIKFSRTREPARITVGGSIEGDEAIYFVRDNGAGFDMQYAGRLFGVFQRLHAVTEFEGTGIGLAIVKRIIIRHGGRVWAEGKPNEGATIYFALPREDKDHA